MNNEQNKSEFTGMTSTAKEIVWRILLCFTIFICLVYKNLNAQVNPNSPLTPKVAPQSSPLAPKGGIVQNTKQFIVFVFIPTFRVEGVCMDTLTYTQIRNEIGVLRQIKRIDSNMITSFEKTINLKDSIISTQKLEIFAYQDKVQALEKTLKKQRKRSFWQKVAIPGTFILGIILGKI